VSGRGFKADPADPPVVVSPTDALAFATANVPIAQVGERAGVVRERLVDGGRLDSAAQIAVLQDGRLCGLIRIEDLLSAQRDEPVRSLMDPDPPIISPGTDQEAAALKAVRHQESSLAVVDSDGRFHGLIPPHRMLGVLLEEHREDLARLSGYMHLSAAARSASQARLLLRFWHRFPWLVVGLAAALAAAVIVAGFERNLASHLELAFFIPGIVYIADAVGTQTETLVVRGLSVGVPIGGVMKRELLTGLVLGIVLGLLAFPAIAWWVGVQVALTVAISIWAASTLAAGVAMALPWAFSISNIDPAFGSGPLATVVQDLLSLAVYLVVANMVFT
jgi:magnesium transporter